MAANESAAGDERSPSLDDMEQGDGSTSRTVIANCKRCKSEIGEFYNSFMKVTGSYYLPALPASYSLTGLVPFNKPKPASSESSLVGCLIQPLVCANGECRDTLGIIVCRTPEDKRTYANRELFKLPKIQLKSDVTGEDVTAIIEDSNNDQPAEAPTASMSMDTTEDAAVAQAKRASASVQPSASTTPNIERHEPSPCLTTIPEPPKAPSIQKHHSPEISRLPPMAPAHPQPQPVPPRAVPRVPNGYPQPNGFASSAPSNIAASQPPIAARPPSSWPDSRFEAIDRMQAQSNLNRAGLEQHVREIQRINHTLDHLQRGLNDLTELVNGVIAEVRNRPPPTPAPAANDRMDDDHFELLTSQITTAMSKTAEIDDLKLKVALLERKLRRQASIEATPSTAVSNHIQGSRDSALPHLQQMLPSVPHLNAPRPPQTQVHSQTQQHVPRLASYTHPYTPDNAKPREILYHDQELPSTQHPAKTVEAPAPAGWTSVNTATKRGYPNGVDAHSEHSTPMASPKRPKLTPLEPRQGQGYPPDARYDPRHHTVESEEKLPRLHSEPSAETAYPDSTNASTFIPYSHSQEGHPDDHWGHHSHYVASGASETPSTGKSPRGRGRGRGGRPRKNPVSGEHQVSMPEWEKPGWLASQHVSEDGFYHHPDMTPTAAKRGGLIRRGSGGHGNRVPIPPATQTSILPSDPYAHTKKTRTKPIRNADGVLIRKDGRPDMRSQSSAANLRKVHARREEEKRLEAEMGASHTPSKLSGSWTATNVPNGTDSVASSPAVVEASESPASQVPDADVNRSTEERTKDIIKHMFPRGIEEQKSRMMQAQDYFPRTEGKSPHPEPERSQPSEEPAAPTPQDADVRMTDASPEEPEPPQSTTPPSAEPATPAVGA